VATKRKPSRQRKPRRLNSVVLLHRADKLMDRMYHWEVDPCHTCELLKMWRRDVALYEKQNNTPHAEATEGRR